jgi:hypothetical protein
MSRRRSTRSTHRAGSAAASFLFVLAVVLACGSLAAWTPAPDGLIGFLAVALVLVGGLASGGHSRGHSRSRSRSRRRYR